MSYNHQEVDWWLNANAGTVVSGGAADPMAATALRIGYQPAMAIAIYALYIVVPTVVAPTVTFKFRPTPLSATGEIVIGILTLPLLGAVGNMIFKTVDNVKCTPGGEIVASTNGAATAGTVQLGVLLAPNWDSPGNNLKMIRSA